jgi:hypothetical protein
MVTDTFFLNHGDTRRNTEFWVHLYSPPCNSGTPWLNSFGSASAWVTGTKFAHPLGRSAAHSLHYRPSSPIQSRVAPPMPPAGAIPRGGGCVRANPTRTHHGETAKPCKKPHIGLGRSPGVSPEHRASTSPTGPLPPSKVALLRKCPRREQFPAAEAVSGRTPRERTTEKQHSYAKTPTPAWGEAPG